MATEPTKPDHFYSPARIRKLLPDLPYLQTGTYAIDDSEPNDGSKRTSKPRWWGAENALNIAADLTNALDSLEHFTRMVVWRAYVEPDPDAPKDATRRDVESDEHISRILRCTPETVKRHRLKGVDQMAAFLGWVEEPNATKRRQSETVYLNPKLADDRRLA